MCSGMTMRYSVAVFPLAVLSAVCAVVLRSPGQSDSHVPGAMSDEFTSP
jgi:hypothetical protein